jgi:hypothetical protein
MKSFRLCAEVLERRKHAGLQSPPPLKLAGDGGNLAAFGIGATRAPIFWDASPADLPGNPRDIGASQRPADRRRHLFSVKASLSASPLFRHTHSPVLNWSPANLGEST